MHGPPPKISYFQNSNSIHKTLIIDPKIDPKERLEAALASLKLQDKPNYTKTAEQFSVNRTTLSQRHRNVTKLYSDARDNKRLLLDAQSKALIKYINDLTKRGLPPIITIVRNFGG